MVENWGMKRIYDAFAAILRMHYEITAVTYERSNWMVYAHGTWEEASTYLVTKTSMLSVARLICCVDLQKFRHLMLTNSR